VLAAGGQNNGAKILLTVIIKETPPPYSQNIFLYTFRVLFNKFDSAGITQPEAGRRKILAVYIYLVTFIKAYNKQFIYE
jgi:hypothetical protein